MKDLSSLLNRRQKDARSTVAGQAEGWDDFFDERARKLAVADLTDGS